MSLILDKKIVARIDQARAAAAPSPPTRSSQSFVWDTGERFAAAAAARIDRAGAAAAPSRAPALGERTGHSMAARARGRLF